MQKAQYLRRASNAIIFRVFLEQCNGAIINHSDWIKRYVPLNIQSEYFITAKQNYATKNLLKTFGQDYRASYG